MADTNTMKKRSPIYREGTGLVHSKIPSDQIAQQSVTGKISQLENLSPTEKSAVTSIYEARPINAIDFVIRRSNNGLNNTPFQFNFTVPFGVICVIKHFSFSIYRQGIENIDIYGQEVINPARFSILVNNIAQPNYNMTDLGHFVDKQECYILANSNDIVSGRFEDSVSGSMTGNAYFIFYGQYLLASGRPLAVEPGNVV